MCGNGGSVGIVVRTRRDAMRWCGATASVTLMLAACRQLQHQPDAQHAAVRERAGSVAWWERDGDLPEPGQHGVCQRERDRRRGGDADDLHGGHHRPGGERPAAIATYFASLVPIFQQLDSGLKALGNPPEMQAAWTQALAVFDTTVGDFREALSSSQAGNLTAYKTAIAQEQTDNTTGSADFNNIGAAVCGGGGSTAATPTPS